MPVHNWILMVGCVPQMHRGSTLPQEENDLRNTELNIFVSVLRCMRLKWSPANNVLMTIDRLRTMMEDPGAFRPAGVQQDSYPPPTSHHCQAILKNLFPFPSDICPRMALVDSCYVKDTAGITPSPAATRGSIMEPQSTSSSLAIRRVERTRYW